MFGSDLLPDGNQLVHAAFVDAEREPLSEGRVVRKTFAVLGLAVAGAALAGVAHDLPRYKPWTLRHAPVVDIDRDVVPPELDGKSEAR